MVSLVVDAKLWGHWCSYHIVATPCSGEVRTGERQADELLVRDNDSTWGTFRLTFMAVEHGCGANGLEWHLGLRVSTRPGDEARIVVENGVSGQQSRKYMGDLKGRCLPRVESQRESESPSGMVLLHNQRKSVTPKAELHSPGTRNSF